MSKAISLKIREDIVREVEQIREAYKMPRNTYINQALSLYNQLNRRKSLQKKLHLESGMVRESSLEILSQLESIEDTIIE
jgi:predicted transcriptional regulator